MSGEKVSGEIIAGKSVGGNYGLQGEKMRVSVSYLGKSETQGGLWLTGETQGGVTISIFQQKLKRWNFHFNFPTKIEMPKLPLDRFGLLCYNKHSIKNAYRRV
jgi:hypothetical protein